MLLYRALLSPLVRPIAWRVRGFVLTGLQESLAEHARTQEVGVRRMLDAQARVLAELQERFIEIAHRVDNGTAVLRTQLQDSFLELRARHDRIVDVVHRVDDGTVALRTQLQDTLVELRTRHDRVLDLVHRVDDGAALRRAQQDDNFVQLRARADKVVDATHRIELALREFGSQDSGLTRLAPVMENALLSLATIGRAQGRAQHPAENPPGHGGDRAGQ